MAGVLKSIEGAIFYLHAVASEISVLITSFIQILSIYSNNK